MEIDWNEAPEWAKGHGLVAPLGQIRQVWYGDQAYMILGDSRSYCYGGGDGDTRHNHMPNQIQFKTPRPATMCGITTFAEMVMPWSGEGLPPVGTVCEAKMPPRGIQLIPAEWVWRKVEVVKSGMPGAENECLVFDVENTAPSWVDQLRPIRTPEQIEAEERQAAIENALIDVKGCRSFPVPGDVVRENITVSVVKAMIDAGYRKQVKP